jgi:outer membrane receptor protein involved in Fe transport
MPRAKASRFAGWCCGLGDADRCPCAGRGARAKQAGAPDASDIVVTATRIARDGYTAPTPTTVVGQEFVQQRHRQYGRRVECCPAFAAVSPNAGGLGNTGAFLADLRGLGLIRTLVLLDRGRMPQTIIPGVTTSAGTTDLNVIPTVLIKNSDVVTGGASAAYGSDAVAGVINFQTDDRFVGLKGSAQYGETRYGDAKTSSPRWLWHAFAGGRGHFVIGGEYNDDGGTGYYNTARSWGRRPGTTRQSPIARQARPAPCGPNGNYFGTATSGGLILPLARSGTGFVPTEAGRHDHHLQPRPQQYDGQPRLFHPGGAGRQRSGRDQQFQHAAIATGPDPLQCRWAR